MVRKSITGIGVLALLLVSVGWVHAGEKLGKGEVINLISGNTVEAYYLAEGQVQMHTEQKVGLKFRFYSGGGAEKTTYPAGATKSAFTEKGKWFFNKNGMLCTAWKSEKKKRCGFLHRSIDGKLELRRKGVTLFFEKITPGT